MGTRAEGLLRFMLAALAPACQVVAGYEGFQPAESAPHPCDVLPAAKQDPLGLALMQRIDIAHATCYWIDRTEVTVRQYSEWQAMVASDAVTWEPTWCRWKVRRSDPIGDPNDSCATALVSHDLQPFAPDKPMRCVDFCEAEAFCRFAGKRLCHDEDSLGVQAPRGLIRDWVLACTNDLSTAYPWGNQPAADLCNSGHGTDTCITSLGNCGVVPVGQQSQCKSRASVSDLLGNVAEWVFSCNVISPTSAPAPTNCMTRGGGYDTPLLPCDTESPRSNDTRTPSLGFRCCADLTAQEQLEIAPGLTEK